MPDAADRAPSDASANPADTTAAPVRTPRAAGRIDSHADPAPLAADPPSHSPAHTGAASPDQALVTGRVDSIAGPTSLSPAHAHAHSAIADPARMTGPLDLSAGATTTIDATRTLGTWHAADRVEHLAGPADLARIEAPTTRRPGPPTTRPDSPAAQARAARRRGWYLYGWGAHAFPTTVLAVFLGPYLTDIAQNAAGGEKHYLHILGVAVRAESFYPFAVTAAALLQAAVLPLVGALADRSGRTRQMLAGAMAVGVAATLAFYTVTGGAYLYGAALFLVANLGYGTANVLANGYLPALATPDERDAISSKGWAIGYLGGAALLTVDLVVFTLHDSLGLSKSHAARVALASAGLWWLVFGMAGLRRLRGPSPLERAAGLRRPETDAGYRQVARTLRALARNRNALLFLLAYVAYNEGVQTVISFASTYGDKELGLGQSVMASAILLVQFVAFGGALWLGRLAGRHGSRSVIAGSLVAWVGVLAVAYFMAKGTAWQFYVLGCAIGVVLGGTQALSRSLFAQIIPAGQEGEYFGLYEISQNGTAWIGSLTIAMAIQITGSYRLAIVSLVAFFLVGLFLLLRTDLREAIREAGNPVPERL